MRGGIPIVVFIVGLVISVMLFFICSYILDVTVSPIQEAVNSTLSGVYQSHANGILSNLRTWFGAFSVIFVIGIVIAYALDTHREEGEEFGYYNQYY